LTVAQCIEFKNFQEPSTPISISFHDQKPFLHSAALYKPKKLAKIQDFPEGLRMMGLQHDATSLTICLLANI